MAPEAATQVASGVDPAEKPRETVADVAALWVERHVARKTRPKSGAEIRHYLDKEILPVLGKRPVVGITKRDCRELIEAVAERAPIASNRCFAVLSALFDFCLAQEILAVNPMVGLKKASVEKSRERVLSDSELAAVWRSAAALQTPFGADGPDFDFDRRTAL